MKSERQQIQESNLLADKIEAFLVKTRNSLPKIIAVVAVSLVALLVYGIYRSVQQSGSAKAWTAFYFSDSDATELESVADDFSKTSAGLWARQQAGDAHLAKALETVFTNRGVADQHYKNAIEDYKKVVDSADEGFLLARSYYGLAQAQEGLGERDEAISSYRKVGAQSNIDPEFKDEAAKRAFWLESKDGEAFFAWYNTNRASAPPIAPSDTSKPSLPGSPTIDFSSANPVIPPSAPVQVSPPADETKATASNPSSTTTPPAEEKKPESTPPGSGLDKP